MKLYYSPGSCSLSPHIALLEAGLPFDLVRVNVREKKTSDGADFWKINPKGAVPALGLDDGQVLTEGAVIVQYVADQKPESHLAPKAGTMERYRLQEWLNHIASDLHKSFSPLYSPVLNDDAKAFFRANIQRRFAATATQLEKTPFLMGDTFSVADGYLFVMLTWAKARDIEFAPSLHAFFDRVAARPAVQKAMQVTD
jgi:glutathione S-transferase